MLKKICPKVIAAILVSAAAVSTTSARADDQTFPTHPITLVVPFSPGGATDALARALAEATRAYLPQAIIVQNKPGASSGIGLTEVARSNPDGYKLALVTADMVTIPHLGLTKTTAQNFTSIIQLNADPSAVTVLSSSPYNTIEELIQAARASPEGIKMGNAGHGSTWHLAALALEINTKVKFNNIPFQGGNMAVSALLGGHIDAVTVSPAEVGQYVRTGKFKTLAVMADRRVTARGFENVPTLKERGIDVTLSTWRGIAAPRNTPQPVLDKLALAFAKAADEPKLKQFMVEQDMGYAVADKKTFDDLIVRDNIKFKRLIDMFGLNVN